MEPSGKVSESREINTSSLETLLEHLHRVPARSDVNPYLTRIHDIPEWVVLPSVALELRGNWQSRFDAPRPLFVELGSGYGQFLTELAYRESHHNYIGLELKFKRLFKAAQRAAKQGLHNLQFLRFNALLLDHIFAPSELSGIFIQFPDPWPKSQQLERRMISPHTVRIFEQLLPVGGRVQLKSDYEPYRDVFRTAFVGSQFALIEYVADLQDWAREAPNIQTGYERRFTREGRTCFFYEYSRTGS